MKKSVRRLCTAFLLLTLGVGLLSGCGKEEEVVTTDLLRVGILSDIHVGFHDSAQQSDRFEKALMFFKNKGVDAILIAGDLQEHSSATKAIPWIEEVADIWFRVFPDSKNDLTGERVEPLMIYGNHDIGLVEAEYWPESLGEYQDAWLKEVKGYQFVGVNYTKEGTELAANLVGKAEALSEDKPFFFCQHQPVVDTVLGESEGLLGTGVPMYDVLRSFENCVVFTGHTHIPITDERSIWQTDSKKGARFTAINCATINYGWLKSYTDMDINGCADDTQQGMYMTVDGPNVHIERYSFFDMELIYDAETTSIDMSQAEQIGAPWVFDATEKKHRPYDYDTRQLKAGQPVFPEGAQLDVSSVGETIVNIFVPAALVDSPEGYSDLIQSYYAEAVDLSTGEVVATAEVATEHHVDIDERRLQKEVFMGLEGLEPGVTYELRVYARECYQKTSDPLTAQVTTLEKTD